ncbi:MAG TPA: SpoIIE family protein phosphatase [Clostridiaceae bacterium]|nr:SpoIIE family protein phosphatase [Clostridiaceae bacterium]
MAKLLMFGLTDSGTSSKVNEDTFSCQGRIYPDMISGHEEKSVGSTDYSQLYVITEGFGGPTVGDLSGRVAQSLAHEMANNLDAFRSDTLDFEAFAQEFLTEADHRIKLQIKNKSKQPAGTSLCLLLIDGNEAYVVNIGSTSSFLFREDEVLRLTKPNLGQNGMPAIWLGQDGPLEQKQHQPSINHLTLTPGDIILLTTHSVYSAYSCAELKQEFISPDAFTGTIRSIHENSVKGRERTNHTTLAVKVQNLDLNHVTPRLVNAGKAQDTMPNPYKRPNQNPSQTQDYKSGSYREKEAAEDLYDNALRAASRAASAAQEHNSQGSRNMQDGNHRQGREYMDDFDDNSDLSKEENPFSTFFRSLLLGFLIGLVLLLIVWIFLIG